MGRGLANQKGWSGSIQIWTELEITQSPYNYQLLVMASVPSPWLVYARGLEPTGSIVRPLLRAWGLS